MRTIEVNKAYIDPVLRYRVYNVCAVKKVQFRIGELAEKCSVNKETIRYYERIGLIPSLEPKRRVS